MCHEAKLLVHMGDNLSQPLLRVAVMARLVHALLERREQGVVNEVLTPGRVVRDHLGDLRISPDGDGCLVGPGSGHVARRIPAPAEQDHGQAQALAVPHTRAVALHPQVEAPEAIAGQRVGAALQGDGGRPVALVDGANDVLEEGLVLFVRDAVLQRHVDGVVGPRVVLVLGAVVLEPARAGKELVRLVLVERDRHDAVGGEEGLLDAVAVMDVNINVQHARVDAQQLQDGEHNVVDVAEARRLGPFGVMQPAAPGNGDVRLVTADLARGV